MTMEVELRYVRGLKGLSSAPNDPGIEFDGCLIGS